MKIDAGAANDGVVSQRGINDSELDLHFLAKRCRAEYDGKSHRGHRRTQTNKVCLHGLDLPLRYPQLPKGLHGDEVDLRANIE